MKLPLILILYISLTNIIWAQKTYCKLFDLDSSSPFNFPNDMKLHGDKIVIGTSNLCKSNNKYLDCTKLTTFNLEGIQLLSIILVSFSTYSRN